MHAQGSREAKIAKVTMSVRLPSLAVVVALSAGPASEAPRLTVAEVEASSGLSRATIGMLAGSL